MTWNESTAPPHEGSDRQNVSSETGPSLAQTKKHTASKSNTRTPLQQVVKQISSLTEMTTSELQEEHSLVLGEPSRSRNKAGLIKKIAWALQVKAEGGLSKETKTRLHRLGKRMTLLERNEARGESESVHQALREPMKSRDPRLPAPGTELTKIYQGEEFSVRVLEKGFEYEGETFSSLSKVAFAITEKKWNGFAFFGLGKKRTLKPNMKMEQEAV